MRALRIIWRVALHQSDAKTNAGSPAPLYHSRSNTQASMLDISCRRDQLGWRARRRQCSIRVTGIGPRSASGRLVQFTKLIEISSPAASNRQSLLLSGGLS